MLSTLFPRREPIPMLTPIEQARQNMIENQVRPWEVLDHRVLEVLGAVHREAFVPAPWRALAFADLALPIGDGEMMLKPVVEGRLLQALALAPVDSVLQIGTGTGFLAACMARLAGNVTSVEIRPDFADTARANLAAAGVRNANVVVADGVCGFTTDQRFDAVVVGGGVFTLPEHFRDWVRPGGRLFAFVGESPVLRAILHERLDDTHWRNETLFETDLPYLQHAEPPRRFAL
jgi:protein-L-isoaspartate(D-aspartate) O-methyltransferase